MPHPDKSQSMDRKSASLEYLDSVSEARRRLCELDGELAGMLPAVACSLGPMYARAADNGLEALADAVCLLEGRCTAAMGYLRKMGECRQALDQMGGIGSSLLFYRHVLGLEWAEVACRLSYSVRECHRIHDRALRDFAYYAPAPQEGPGR